VAESLLLRHQLVISSRARRRAPNPNSFDRLVFGLWSLYNEARTHLGLAKDTPIPRAVQRSGTIVATPILSGLHHCYARI
jgi:hypothetical protein